jgi:hypothetical protein
MEGENTLVQSCTFVASCVLYCLSFLPDSGLDAMKSAAVGFLAREMKPPGVWKYFSSTSLIDLDPDLDDTACASFVLRDTHPDIRAGRNIDIILGNTSDDGLFFTWLRKKGAPNDVDSVVNANVLLYLGDREETAAVSHYLNKIIAAGREADGHYYYPDDCALYYALTRAYFNGAISLEPAKDRIPARIADRQQKNGSFGNELLTALAICSLLNCSCADSVLLGRGIEYLTNTQRNDGSWPRRAYYGGPLPGLPRTNWYGSEELTTGFCLEALARFQTLNALK